MALCVGSLAILFDVTPGLRGAGGWVAWFFFFSFVMALPAILLGGEDGPRLAELEASQTIVYDPSAMMGLHQLVLQSLPDFKPKSVASGHIVRGADAPPLETVDWPGVRLNGAFRRQRLGTALQAFVPLLLALVLFDRFDPARRSGKKRAPIGAEEEPAIARAQATAAPQRHWSDLPSAVLAPSARRAIVAEMRLSFETLGRWRWLLVAVTLAPAILPGAATGAILLLLATPILATAGAREAQSGVIALVRGQPGVPTPARLERRRPGRLRRAAHPARRPPSGDGRPRGRRDRARRRHPARPLHRRRLRLAHRRRQAVLGPPRHRHLHRTERPAQRRCDGPAARSDADARGAAGLLLFGILVVAVGLGAAIREARRA